MSMFEPRQLNEITFYTSCGFNYKVLTGDGDEVRTLPSVRLNAFKTRYELRKPFKIDGPTDEALFAFRDEMLASNAVLKREGIDLFCYKNWSEATKFIFSSDKISGNAQLRLPSPFRQYFGGWGTSKWKVPPIEGNELALINQCHGARMHFNQSLFEEGAKETVPMDVHTVDGTSFYPTCLTKIKVPLGPPEEKHYETFEEVYGFAEGFLQSKVKPALYMCVITSQDPVFTQVFLFNKKPVYTTDDLYIVNYFRKQGCNINVEMVLEEGQPNCFIYHDVVNGKEMFGKWFAKLSGLRAKHPQMACLKILLSQLWGNLTAKRKFIADHVTEDQRPSQVLWNGDVFVASKSYEHPIARIYPFLTGFIRRKIAMEARLFAQNGELVRIWVDSITINRPFTEKELKTFKQSHFTPETKSSGTLIFYEKGKRYRRPELEPEHPEEAKDDPPTSDPSL